VCAVKFVRKKEIGNRHKSVSAGQIDLSILINESFLQMNVY